MHREFCGGCTYNGEDYESVLKIKEREALNLFQKIENGATTSVYKETNSTVRSVENTVADNQEDVNADNYVNDFYNGILGCPPDWRFGYRNKMEYTFGDLVKDGPLQLGMHKKGNYMSVITVDNCQLVPDDFNRILRYTLGFAQAHGLNHYHKKTHKGVLRNLIIRRGVRTGEILVDIVTSSEGDIHIERNSASSLHETTANEKPCFDAEAWKEGLLGLRLDGKIVGIMHTINDGLTDSVSCDEQRVLFGRDYYYEEICGLKFKVGIFSFFQTNVNAVERMYNEAVALLTDLEGKTVYDLFCGTGTISQIVARLAKEVIGVEIVEDSVESARVNAKLNNINNCKFICGDVFEVLSKGTYQEDSDIDSESDKDETEYSVGSAAFGEALTEILPESLPEPDVIIVDPPRIGLRTKSVNKIASYGVAEILYISCNPKTLAMDLADFKLCGYEPKYIKLYDNFPWTKHVETVVYLSKLNTDGHVKVEVDMSEFEPTGSERRKIGTYAEIKKYVEKKYGFKVSTLYISQIKKKCGLNLRPSYNPPKKEDYEQPQCPPEKEEAIMDALRYFKYID